MNNSTLNDLAGKTAIVTGASRGIGLAIAKRLIEYEVQVVLAARSVDKLEEHVDSITAQGHGAMSVQCDVAVFQDVEATIGSTLKHFGRLDILVNNAGTIEPIARISDSDPVVWSQAVDINMKGVYHGLRAAIPVMESQGSGVIVNLSSGAANSALEGWSHYCSTKAAVKKLTECAHKEVAEKGVRVVGLSPGTVATDMMASIKDSGINPVSQLDWSTHIPPEWAAEAVAFLCSTAGEDFDGTDFSIKTEEGKKLVGLIK